jgi:HK97 family phage prohead protease
VSHKAFTGIEIKSADLGEVTACFSTFNVIDSDMDVTLPGAFEDGAEVVISAYGHKSWSGALPVGKGIIRTTKTQALLEGTFFLDTDGGKDTFAVVKQLGTLGQWSYGYQPVKFSYGEFEGQQVRFLEQQKVDEVSPVLVGAGVNTRTIGAKAFEGMRFGEEADAVMTVVKALTDRAADIVMKRAEHGKGLGADSARVLEDIEAELKRFAELLRAQPADAVPDHSAIEREFMRFMRATAN